MASRISEQNTLVETHNEGSQLICRNGSLVIKNEKGRDRERFPIVYGARFQESTGCKASTSSISTSRSSRGR